MLTSFIQQTDGSFLQTGREFKRAMGGRLKSKGKFASKTCRVLFLSVGDDFLKHPVWHHSAYTVMFDKNGNVCDEFHRLADSDDPHGTPRYATGHELRWEPTTEACATCLRMVDNPHYQKAAVDIENNMLSFAQAVRAGDRLPEIIDSNPGSRASAHLWEISIDVRYHQHFPWAWWRFRRFFRSLPSSAMTRLQLSAFAGTNEDAHRETRLDVAEILNVYATLHARILSLPEHARASETHRVGRNGVTIEAHRLSDIDDDLDNDDFDIGGDRGSELP